MSGWADGPRGHVRSVSVPPLSPTAYVVLGLVRMAQPCTSYDMKRLVNVSIGHFWSFPHSQLYAEPRRLADAGLLSEEVETEGRKRRLFRLTPEGEAAFAAAFDQPSANEFGVEIRDEAALRVFFSAGQDRAALTSLAHQERDRHRAKLAELDRMVPIVADSGDTAQARVLTLGQRIERVLIDFWDEIEADPPVSATPTD